MRFAVADANGPDGANLYTCAATNAALRVYPYRLSV
jgi:hypothetical protein